MAKTDWKQGAVQGWTPYPPSLTHTDTADTDRRKRANDDLRVQYKLNKDYFRDTGDRGRSQSKQMMPKTENGLKTQKPKIRSDKRRSRSRSLIRKRGVG